MSQLRQNVEEQLKIIQEIQKLMTYVNSLKEKSQQE